jgi:hypothetical protein
MQAFVQRFGRKPTQLSADPTEARLATVGDSITLKLMPVWKALRHAAEEDEENDDFGYTCDDVFRYAKALGVDIPAVVSPRIDFKSTNVRREELVALSEECGMHKDFTALLHICHIPESHCATREMERFYTQEGLQAFYHDWETLRAEPEVRKMLEAEMGGSWRPWVVAWHMMQTLSDHEDRALGLRHPNLRFRVLSFVAKWRLYFRPRLYETGKWSDDGDVALADDEFRISPFVSNPYTPEQQEVLKAIHELNKVYAKHGGYGSPKMGEIVSLKADLEKKLAKLADRPDLFSFNNNNALIMWPGREGKQTKMAWRFLCQPNGPDYPHASEYLGVIKRNQTNFKSR